MGPSDTDVPRTRQEVSRLGFYVCVAFFSGQTKGRTNVNGSWVCGFMRATHPRPSEIIREHVLEV